jgi:hypothetical protein
MKDYYAIFNSQNGVCAVCNEPGGKISLAVDHDHVTGHIRGLLCVTCNVLLGRIEKDRRRIQLISDYLAQRSQATLWPFVAVMTKRGRS